MSCVALPGIAVAQPLPGCSVPSLGNCLPSCGVSSHFCAKSTKTSLSCSLITLLFSCSHLSAECAAVCPASSVPVPGQPLADEKNALAPPRSRGQEPARTRHGVVSAEDSVTFAGHSSERDGMKRNHFDASFSLLLHPQPCQMFPLHQTLAFHSKCQSPSPDLTAPLLCSRWLLPRPVPLSAAWDMLSDLSQDICSSCHFLPSPDEAVKAAHPGTVSGMHTCNCPFSLAQSHVHISAESRENAI